MFRPFARRQTEQRFADEGEGGHVDGVARKTVADALAGAGIAKDTFYLYFESKEDLVAALQARYQESLITRAQAILDSPGPHLQRLDRFIAATVDSPRPDPPAPPLFHDIGLRDDQSMQRLTGLLTAFIADGAAAGVFHAGDPGFPAAFVIHGLHGVVPPSCTTAPLAAPPSWRPRAPRPSGPGRGLTPAARQPQKPS